MTVYLRDGQWLFVNGQLATGEGCCCGGACCRTACGCGSSVTVTGLGAWGFDDPLELQGFGYADYDTAAASCPGLTGQERCFLYNAVWEWLPDPIVNDNYAVTFSGSLQQGTYPDELCDPAFSSGGFEVNVYTRADWDAANLGSPVAHALWSISPPESIVPLPHTLGLSNTVCDNCGDIAVTAEIFETDCTAANRCDSTSTQAACEANGDTWHQGQTCADNPCSGPCYTVLFQAFSGCFGFGSSACACCAGYGLDYDAVVAGMDSYITGVLSGVFTGRGFTVGTWQHNVTELASVTFGYTIDGDTCHPEGECEALIRTGDLWTDICLHCDGVIVADETLDPIPPSEEFTADSSECLEGSSCGPVTAWQYNPFVYDALRCVPCGGACDEENPCPGDPESVFGSYACVCVDGECQRVLVENPFP